MVHICTKMTSKLAQKPYQIPDHSLAIGKYAFGGYFLPFNWLSIFNLCLLSICAATSGTLHIASAIVKPLSFRS